MSLSFIQNVKSQVNDAKRSDMDDPDNKRNKSEFNLNDAIQETLKKMKKDRGNDSNKKIPEGFLSFAESTQFKDLLEAMLDYNRELFRLENKQ